MARGLPEPLLLPLALLALWKRRALTSMALPAQELLARALLGPLPVALPELPARRALMVRQPSYMRQR